MLPRNTIERARHRAWIEYASTTLAEIGGLYSAPDAKTFDAKRQSLAQRFERLAGEIKSPWFGGCQFGLVDAAFGPVFRYLDVFESEADVHLLRGLPAIADWRAKLAARPSVRAAAVADYPARLRAFLLAKGSYISELVRRISDNTAARVA